LSKNSSKNNLETMDRITQKYFSEIEQYVPHLQQSLFDYQNEYYKIWKNFVNSNISLYGNLGTEFGLSFPEPNQKLIENIHDEIIQYRSSCHKIIIKSIESGKDYAKVWNENVQFFDELNQKIIQNWLSLFTPTSSKKTNNIS